MSVFHRCTTSRVMDKSIFAQVQITMEFTNVQVLILFNTFRKISWIISDLPAYRNGSMECNLTPQEAGKFKGCVNWNMFYTNCRFHLLQTFEAIFHAYFCSTGPNNPFHGAVSFDNIGLAWVAIFLVMTFFQIGLLFIFIFQVISLEGWTDVMYIIQDVHSFYNFVYFVVLIIVGNTR